jgi:hypothetical protein
VVCGEATVAASVEMGRGCGVRTGRGGEGLQGEKASWE